MGWKRFTEDVTEVSQWHQRNEAKRGRTEDGKHESPFPNSALSALERGEAEKVSLNVSGGTRESVHSQRNVVRGYRRGRERYLPWYKKGA